MYFPLKTLFIATLQAVLVLFIFLMMRIRRSLSAVSQHPQKAEIERQRRRYRKKGKTDLSESGIKCTRCDGRNIVFLRGEGRVYCNLCKLKFPPPCCDTCQHPETKPHHAKERRWRCLGCTKTFTISGVGSPSKRRCGRKRRAHSDEDEDAEFDCFSFTESSVAMNRPKRTVHLRKAVEENCDDIEDKEISYETMDNDDHMASEGFDSAESELFSGQESAVNSSLDCIGDHTSISDMKRIAARLTVMMAVYGRPTSYAPLLQDLYALTSAFDRSKLALCAVNAVELDPLEMMAYASTLTLFTHTTYEIVSTLLDYTMIPYYRDERDVMRPVMQFLIGVANTRLIEFDVAPLMAKHISTLASAIDRYSTTGTHDTYILDVALILFRLAAVHLSSPAGNKTKLTVDDCGKVFTAILRCLYTMIRRPLSQKPVWDILVTLKQHPIFYSYMMTAANSMRLREVIKTTQDVSTDDGKSMMSSVRDSIQLCLSAYSPSAPITDGPDHPARVTDCRNEGFLAPNKLAF